MDLITNGKPAPLAIIPCYVSSDKSVSLVCKTIETLHKTAPHVKILVVDDASPTTQPLKPIKKLLAEVGGEIICKEKNEGFSKTVNIGLRHARHEWRDAILVNADIEFRNDTWLSALQDTEADVVGALLTYSNGIVQHAGVYYSILRREHDHRFRMAPSTLNAVQEEIECPVTGALMYIRYKTLQQVGLFDEKFQMGWEDVDYCIRVFESGRKCVYQPKAVAVHHESMFRKGKNTKSQKWFEDGLQYLRKKHLGKDMSQYCPTMIEWPS